MSRLGRRIGPQPVNRPFLFSANHARLLLAAILLIAALLRLWQLNTQPRGLYRDEAMNGNNALQVLETGRFQVFYPENNGREGLFINACVPFVYLLGNTALAIRLPAAIFGILTVWGVYCLAAEFFPVPVGLVAAFFVATSYWHLTFSRMALRANAAGFFLAWGLFLLVAAVRRLRPHSLAPDPRPLAPGIRLMALAGAVYGLGFHTYIAYRATPLLVAIMLIYYLRQARKEGWTGAFWKGSMAFIAAAFVVVLPLLVYFAQNPGTFFGRTAQVSVTNNPNPALTVAGNIWKTALMFFVSGDTNWRHNYDGRPELYWPVAILFAVGIVSAFGEARRGSFAHGTMLGWLAITAAPVVLSNDAIPHALRSVLMIPPVFVLAAVGAHRAYAYVAPRLSPKIPPKIPPGVQLGLGALLALALCWQPYHTYFDLWLPNAKVASAFDAGLVDIAEQINALPAATPKVIAVVTGGDLANGTPLSVAPVVYLTRSYTRKEQDAANIHYMMPAAGEPAAGFCEKVGAALPQAVVVCVR
jgi:4-amino-4-deoxy-L-arabinose transferase-like glycosyltransferase